jgi:argininosuccinate lyase
MIQKGISFRDAYRKMAAQIESGTYTPEKRLKHTHKGSLGNLCLDEIRTKMDQAWTV